MGQKDNEYNQSILISQVIVQSGHQVASLSCNSPNWPGQQVTMPMSKGLRGVLFHIFCTYYPCAWVRCQDVIKTSKLNDKLGISSFSIIRSPGQQVTKSSIRSPARQVTRSPGHQLVRSPGHQVTRSAGRQVCRSQLIQLFNYLIKFLYPLSECTDSDTPDCVS